MHQEQGLRHWEHESELGFSKKWQRHFFDTQNHLRGILAPEVIYL